ncbi:ABC transporter ATP-binding protein [Methylobacterium organophilum]|uniref:ABC transporter ATP-binding protein n=1 Tax=Methylobacterium organophilum TaxID=410 RepID=UPI001F13E2CD|nr:ABC transporter ATP-binding protein [Methylobacterium organophilum]UMY16337.1 ABC transporter ATP-binding protein [Methylobacterium organophilum]
MQLELDRVSVHYGRLAALRDVSLRVTEGEVVAIVGPNGAGKTTTLLTVSGILAPTRGGILFGGTRIDRRAPEDIARLGLAHVREGRHTFTTMTVEENLLVGLSLRRDKAAARREMAALMERFPQLGQRRGQPAGKLSGGEQQMLVIARALLSKPRLMVIDEPSLGLAPLVVDRVYETLLDLNRSDGLTLLIVEQKLERALEAAGRIYVLRGGALQAEGSPANPADTDRIRQAYFGFTDAPAGGIAA